MIQRNLLRQSRALSSSFSARPSSTPFLRQPSYFRASIPRASTGRITSRWYSEAAESKKEETPPTETKESEPPTPAEDPLKKELEAKTKEIIDLKDKYLRSIADFRNLQTRTQREIQAAKDFALQRFSADLIESVDNLDRALSTVAPAVLTAPDANKDLIALHDGLKMTDRILMQTLKKHGLERFDPSEKGDKFDPNVHEAVFMTPQEGKEDGTCFFTQQKGFLLNGRVVRAAKVGVVKNS